MRKLFGLLLAAGACLVLAQEVRVFELRHAEAETLLPLVQQILREDESASVFRNSLVVNADPATLARIDALLPDLDRPLRNLRIELRRKQASYERIDSDSVRGSVGNAELRVGNESRTGVQISTTRRTGKRGLSGSQSIRALEGRPVLISDGQLIGLLQPGYWDSHVTYQHLQQGFTATARVQGETVRIELQARNDSIENGEIRTGDLSSTLSGRLGEWIDLGGYDSASRDSGSDWLSRYSTAGTGSESLQIRVQLLD